jgi:ADP-ribose pyrophosphatase YjhB (NUDIX family)
MPEMHFIDKHILHLLGQHPSRRFSELKLARIESNTFTYHLRRLIERGYVRKVARGYALTSKGVHHSTTVRFEDYSIRIQPKIVTLAVCKNKQGKFLMYQRTKQPFLDMIGFPYGKIHLGEGIRDAAERDLIEKTGFAATLTQKGILYLLVTDTDGEVIVHMLCHIFLGTDPKEVTEPSRAQLGEVLWMSKSELEKTPTMPGVIDVLRIATNRTKNLQFDEVSFVHTQA